MTGYLSCDYCGRHIQQSHWNKGDCYCTLRCLNLASQEATKRRKLLYTAGTMVGVAILAFLILSFTMTKARAQDGMTFHATHDQGHPEYSKWVRPDKGGSCCDAKVWTDVNGVKSFTGHCYEARDAVLVGKIWYVEFDNGMWWRVPPERVLHNHEGTPNPGVAHICENYGYDKKDPVLCFREPVGGS